MYMPLPFYRVCRVLIFAVLLAGFVAIAPAMAAPDDRLSGWAWSDNIGWISMNCTNTESCDTVDYGVTVSGTGATQALSGWAWSDNIGWINFGEANLQESNLSLHGLGIVYSTIQEPYCNSSDPYQTNSSGEIGATGGSYTCSNNSNDDNWEGVISLSGSSPNYGPVADAVDDTSDGWDWPDNAYYMFNGYAWGGTNIGWIKFSCQDSDGGGIDTNTCGTVGYGVYLDPFYMDFSANKGLTPEDAVANGGSFSHIWTLTPDTEVSSCVGSGGPGTWKDSPNKSTSPSPLSQTVLNATSSATSTLSCTHGITGKTLTRNLYVYIKPPPPSISFTSIDYNIPYNDTTMLLWTTANIASCEASGGDAVWNGSIATGTNKTYTTQQLTSQSYTYNMTCQSDSPSYYDAVLATLEITVQKLTLDFFASNADGERITDQNELQSYSDKDSINLNWKTEFATGGCVASGDWSGTKVAANPNNDIVDGSETASTSRAGGSYSYTLTCDGADNQQEVRTIYLRVSKNPGFSEEISNDLQ
ncbi:MAG: hypothetical protein ACKKL4_02545 [Patescibacteria group bacterium]